MSANDHQETDSRICLHVDDALNEGATTVLIRTVDTCVVVFLVGIFHDLAQHHPGMQLWVGFGTGKQHLSSAVKAKCQQGKQGKHIRQPLLGAPDLHLQHLDRLSDLHVSCSTARHLMTK